MTTILKIIGIAVFGILAVIFMFLFGLWILGLFAGILAIFTLAWAVGAPITVKEDGVKTGYIRWFTFYPNQNPQKDA